MSVIWSGVTEEGAVVPVQVTDEGKVVAVGDGPQGDYLPTSGGNLTGDLTLGVDKITLNAADGSASFSSGDVNIDSSGRLLVGETSSSGIETINCSGSSTGATGLFIHNQNGAANSSADLWFGNWVGSTAAAPQARIQAINRNVNTAETDLAFWLYNGGTAAEKMRLDSSGDALIGGTLPKEPNITLKADGQIDALRVYSSNESGNSVFRGYDTTTNKNTFGITGNGTLSIGTDLVQAPKISLKPDGGAIFSSDVVVGSRGEKWLIRESNGVAMLIQQSREAAPMVSPMIPEKVRDIPAELDLIEMALNEVMEKLRMTPPAGWPVWDGSDNP